MALALLIMKNNPNPSDSNSTATFLSIVVQFLSDHLKSDGTSHWTFSTGSNSATASLGNSRLTITLKSGYAQVSSVWNGIRFGEVARLRFEWEDIRGSRARDPQVKRSTSWGGRPFGIWHTFGGSADDKVNGPEG